MRKTIVSLISIMLLGTLLWQCERQVTPLSSEAKKQLSRLPESATGMAYVNVAKIKESEFFPIYKDSIKSELLEDEDYKDFTEVTGFDFTEDVNQMYITFAPGESRNDKNFLVVVTGNFDEDKIIGFISSHDERHKLISEKNGDHTIYQIEDKRVRFAFPDKTTLIVGVEGYVTSWLDSDHSTDKWIERMEKMRYKDGVCFTMDAKALIHHIKMKIDELDEGKKFQALKSVEDVYFSMDADKEIRFEGKGKFTDAQNAELFRDAIKGVLATIKISVSGDREAVDVFNKIKIDQDGNWITSQFKMSKEDIKKLMKTRPKEMIL